MKEVLYINLEIDVRESDSRKENAHQFFLNNGFTKEEISVKQLPIGDFLFDKKVVFEYKTATDLISSIMDSRVFRQSKRMQQYPFHYIIVVGNVFDEIRDRYSNYENPLYAKYRNGKVKPFTVNNYIGALATLFETDKVIHVENENHALTIMKYLATNILTKNKDVRAVDKPVCKMTDAVGTFLACIDGISIKKALLIKNALGIETLRDLLDLDYDSLVSIKGVGSKTAKKILEEIG